MNELIRDNLPLNVLKASEILRNQKGLNGKNIGLGNEKAINQLLAHHSIIFKPEERKVWVSSNPFQLGEYVCYDLNHVFKISTAMNRNLQDSSGESDIPPDRFLASKDYLAFLHFKELRKIINNAIKEPGKKKITDNFIKEFVNTNPEYYDTYRLIGDYYRMNNEVKQAAAFYEKALSKEIATLNEQEDIQRLFEEMKEN